jgi:hypothetical protein
VHTNYFWFGVLTRTTLGVAASANATDPYLQLPQGSVLVNSALPGGGSSVKSLLFGGNPSGSSLDNRTIQLSNQLSWYTANNRHTLRLTSGVTTEAFTSDVSANLRGSYAFNSLADLDSGRASLFTRTLEKHTQNGRQVTGLLSLGDYWRPSEGLQVQYGLRVDGNRFLSAPALNQMLADSLRLRNDAVPNRVYFSPRVGVQWFYGTAPEVQYAPGSARPPRAVVHAGAGIFQNVGSAQLISPAVNATGLPSSAQTVACVGSAIPFPDWAAFLSDPSTIPKGCGPGFSGSPFSATTPSVVLFDPRFRQPQSVRSAADWSGPILDNRFVLGVQAIASLGLAEQGTVDVNFDSTTRFRLANEAGRPVFAPVGSIVPATGGISTSATRLSTAFQRVSEERSNLRIDSRQLSINLKPVTASARLRWDLTYAVLDSREQSYGFANTAGNPWLISWAANQQAGRHTVQLGWNDFPIFDLLYISSVMRLTSGPKYTPMVSGDVNGDGALNDRAFIFDAATADSASAAGIRSVLASGTSSARDCLKRQLGNLASRGSCQAPWTATAGLQIKFNPQKIGLPKRLSVACS